ncbi:ATP-binding protein [Pantanalinema sp. GBBB05]|uniref:ATP-binding protein n=1 Tax=Pantanalinema sp. GBBB05 TaxID=2604139 RepID=UPI003D817391
MQTAPNSSAYSQPDELMFAEEGEEILFATETEPISVGASWKVLIVDDDLEVHEVTKLVLMDFVLEGKSLTFMNAYSALEAKQLMQAHSDIAIVLLDVVMETEHAGLEVVRFIREELNNQLVRIILRTGQPGQAPERKVVVDYSIDAYKTKTELTSQKLFIVMVTALRAFSTMKKMLESSRQLEQEIVQRQQAEAALQESYTLLNSVMEALPDFILVKDLQGRYVMVNSNLARFLGKSLVEEVVGKDDTELFPLATADQIMQKDQTVMTTGVMETFEETVPYQDSQRTYLTTKTPWRDAHGNIIGLIAIARDISDRKQAEECLRRSETQLRQRTEQLEQTLQELGQTQTQLVQSAKMSSLGQLVAGIAHEINNPINFIFGNLTHASEYTQGLLELVELYQQNCPTCQPHIQQKIQEIDLDFLSQDLPKVLQSMQTGSQRIQEIVYSLRVFSRLDEAEVKGVNIHEGIDSTLMILQNRLKAKTGYPGIEVIKAYGQLPLIECYAGQLNQVFMNILSNAIEALEENLVKEQQSDHDSIPTITICTEALPNHRVAIRIADNGPGIPEAVQQRLFDPFFTTKAVGKGTGMGLAISHQIVTEKHGGQLYCCSTPTKGTEFTIEIPVSIQNVFPKERVNQ